MEELHVHPDGVIGYRVEIAGCAHWFLHEAQALAFARDVCPDCRAIFHGADGGERMVYEPLIGAGEPPQPPAAA